MADDSCFDVDWELPTVRIKSVELTNFRNVEQGKIIFNCGRKYVPRGTEADILGLYGQNGSGKSSFIEALDILKASMMGFPIMDRYADCIALNKDTALLKFVFDLQYDGGIIRTAQYSFCLKKQLMTEKELKMKYGDRPNDYGIPEKAYRVIVFNEKFSLAWEGSKKTQVVIDTSDDGESFVPESKRKILTGNNKDAAIDLKVNRLLASERSQSFIFLVETIKLFFENAKDTIFLHVLVELQMFANRYLYVVTTKTTGLINLNFAIPIYLRDGGIMFNAVGTIRIKDSEINFIREQIEKISTVLSQIVPGLTIALKEVSKTTTKKGEDATNVQLMANRDGLEMPLRDESDGIQKLISVLCLVIDVFNEKSMTVAIDEFDAGIFEYLLGEILQSMEVSGKGQFIFTSHNLRPLEVINDKYLYFTTANPQNRYTRLSHISETNNLRDTYFREIIVCEQKEELYKRTKTYKIVAAIKKAGVKE